MSKMASEKKQLIDVLKRYHDNRFTPGVYEHSIFGKAALLLERSEEVVRCKDCKHFGGHGTCYCHAADENGTPIFVREDDFCSYGERRTDDRS